MLIVSEDPERLVRFYRDGLGVPLEPEEHGSHPHWGCELGDIHFAIHPTENFASDPKAGAGGVKVAFTVFDLASYLEGLRSRGVQILDEPSDGWMKKAAVRDPDGNYVELTQLPDDWFRHLEKRRSAGVDVVARWRARG